MERLGKVMCIFAIIHVRSVQCQMDGVDGGSSDFGPWSEWSSCSSSCIQARKRQCNKKNTSSGNESGGCISDTIEAKVCDIDRCSPSTPQTTKSPTTRLPPTTTTSSAICGKPPKIERATISAGGNVEGATRTYVCNQNTSTEGNTTITCGPDGQWSRTNLYCRLSCGPPPTIPRGAISKGDNLQGTTRTYSCLNNTIMTGTPTITCRVDGQWSKTDLQCRLSCGPPPTIPRAMVSEGNTLIGTTRKYICLRNTIMTGTPTITCGVDGQWSKTNLQCRRKRPDPSETSPDSSSETSSDSSSDDDD